MNIDKAALEKVINRLDFLAGRECLTDDEDFVTVHDYSGSNVDDAYDHGRRDGETDLAREILDTIGVS